MPFICIICRDNLSQSSEISVDMTDNASGSTEILVTTLCGHLFHQSCLTRGFEATSARLQSEGSRNRGNSCPTCNANVSVRRLIRLYPSEVDDVALDRSLRENKELKDELQKVKAENVDLKEKLKPHTNSVFGAMRGQTARTNLATTAIAAVESSPSLNIVECQSMQGGLKFGDKVVWLQLENPQSGTVRWLGKINEIAFAGIDFDCPIGNTFPESGGQVLFACTEGHGRLLPIRELILYSDFYAEDNQSPVCPDDLVNPFLDFEILDYDLTLDPDLYP